MTWSRRRSRRVLQIAARLGAVGAVALIGLVIVAPTALSGGGDSLDGQLRAELRREGFTGRIEQSLDERRQRRVGSASAPASGPLSLKQGELDGR